MALAVVVPPSEVGLTADKAARNYPAEDGFMLSNGEVLGGDFIAFYVGGTLFNEDRERLYDLDHQREVRADILGSADNAVDGELPFVYPPLVAALLAPLSRLPFQRAFMIWALLGSVVGLAGLLYLTKKSGATDLVPIPIVLLVCIGYVPFVVVTFWGGGNSRGQLRIGLGSASWSRLRYSVTRGIGGSPTMNTIPRSQPLRGEPVRTAPCEIDSRRGRVLARHDVRWGEGAWRAAVRDACYAVRVAELRAGSVFPPEELAPALIVARWMHEGDDEGIVLDLEELDEAGAVARLEREAA